MTPNRRQRQILYVSFSVLILFLIYAFAFAPSLRALRALNQSVPDKMAELQRAKAIAQKKKTTEAEIAALEEKVDKRGKAFDLGGFVSSTAAELKLKERCQVQLVPQLRKQGFAYTPSAVSVSLQGVSLKELTDFLYRIHAADKLLTVETVEISLPGAGKTGLHVDMRISTLVNA